MSDDVGLSLGLSSCRCPSTLSSDWIKGITITPITTTVTLKRVAPLKSKILCSSNGSAGAVYKQHLALHDAFPEIFGKGECHCADFSIEGNNENKRLTNQSLVKASHAPHLSILCLQSHICVGIVVERGCDGNNPKLPSSVT